jgi:hypothetical protein
MTGNTKMAWLQHRSCLASQNPWQESFLYIKASASLVPRFAKPLTRKLSVHLRSLEPDEIWLGEDCVLNGEKPFFLKKVRGSLSLLFVFHVRSQRINLFSGFSATAKWRGDHRLRASMGK